MFGLLELALISSLTADSHRVDLTETAIVSRSVVAPRTAQAVLPWAIPTLRDWREENRAEINRRAQVFRAALAPLPEWKIESVGAYFAYLRHPFTGAKAQVVAEKLATERGVLCLPGSYFGPGQEGHLRIAVANVGADILATLTERLKGLAL